MNNPLILISLGNHIAMCQQHLDNNFLFIWEWRKAPNQKFIGVKTI